MDDLVQWLRAQLDTDAARAMAAAEELGADWYYDDGFVLARREDGMVATGSQDFLERERGEHIAEWDPARVLCEIDAKRRRLEALLSEGHASLRPGGSTEIYCAADYGTGEPCDCGRDKRVSQHLRLLALPYADRPGFREEWRP